MFGSARVSGLSRGFALGALLCLLGTGACLGNEGGPDAYPSVQQGVGGQDTGAAGFARPPVISLAEGGIGSAGAPECVLPSDGSPVFKAQRFDPASPARRELFSWTTDEQAAALRRDRVLFTDLGQGDLGPGDPFTFLSEIAGASSASDSDSDKQTQALARALAGDLFSKRRYAWPEPWATRLSFLGDDRGHNLLRIVLESEAWVASVSCAGLSVFDLDNQPVALSMAVLHPERIGAFYYVSNSVLGGALCNNGAPLVNSGYREFIVGNLSMVEEWSLGTQAIHDHLAANLADLGNFLTRIRPCPSFENAPNWNFEVLSEWAPGLGAGADEMNSYGQAVAIPSSSYLPVPRQLGSLIDDLQADLLEPDPLVVEPGSP